MLSTVQAPFWHGLGDAKMTVLVLAGTGEARQICTALSENGVPVLASLSGATRAPKDLGVETRIGGFGGVSGFETVLKERNISAVVDATHPFAAQISQRTLDICTDWKLPYAMYMRPAWVAGAGDAWTDLDDEAHAADVIDDGAVVFLATGRQTLHRFANLQGRRLICRQIDPPEAAFPFEGGSFLVGRPPFTVEDEVALFSDLQIDWLVVKNAGGAASRTKLDAARQLGIRVAMIKRPKVDPRALVFSNATGIVEWAAQWA